MNVRPRTKPHDIQDCNSGEIKRSRNFGLCFSGYKTISNGTNKIIGKFSSIVPFAFGLSMKPGIEPVFFVCAPSEIIKRIVAGIAVSMQGLIAVWPWTDKRSEYESMNKASALASNFMTHLDSFSAALICVQFELMHRGRSTSATPNKVVRPNRAIIPGIITRVIWNLPIFSHAPFYQIGDWR